MSTADSLYAYFKEKRGETGTMRPEGSMRPPVSAPVPPGFERAGKFTYRRVVRVPTPFVGRDPGERFLCARAPLDGLVFFDTETTGLSGGAGTIVFLLGIGHVDAADFVIEQYLLSDFPGEHEFLTLIAPLFDPARVFVSYNGAAFDSHLIVSRFRMNRMELSFPRQYDLLHPTRRLWKAAVTAALGSCSLKNVERIVLGLDRGRDIDGADAPAYYFRFLATGDPSNLEPIVRHNETDVSSLARLLCRIEDCLCAPETLFAADHGIPAPDGGALGRLLLSADPQRAEHFLREAFARGHADCGLLLGGFYKLKQAYAEAVRVWEALFEAADCLQAGIELAIHFEHRARDPARALAVVHRLLEPPLRPAGAALRALEARRTRLEKKTKWKANPDGEKHRDGFMHRSAQ